MAVAVPPEYAGPLERWGPLADREARKYGLTGEQLVAKVHAGESGFRMAAVSSAGARGSGQFMPGTRAAYISRYGVDPWKSPDEAVHATALFMRDQGLAGYNPGGGQSYINYILGQTVEGLGGRGSSTRRGRGSSTPLAANEPDELVNAERRSALVRFLLTVAFVLGGLAIAGLGATRMVGLKAREAIA